MGRYVARRVLQAVLTLFLVMFLLHYLTTLAIQLNGSPALAFFGDQVPTPSQLAAVEARFGLDDPCYDQTGNPCLTTFVQRLGDYAMLDFGTTLRGRPITDVVATALPNTLKLFAVLFLTWGVVGLLLGSIAAKHRGKAPDTSARLLSILIDAFPIFVALLVYRYIFAVPISNWLSDQFGSDNFLAIMFKPSFNPDHSWLTVIVPGVLLGLAQAAPLLRLVRAAQLENYGADHVRTAKSKGLSDRRITIFHIVRNSSIPVVTAVGILFAEALAGAVVTEGIMNIDGMGGAIWSAVEDSDQSVVIGTITILAIATVGVMLVVDILYAVLDPRIRYE